MTRGFDNDHELPILIKESTHSKLGEDSVAKWRKMKEDNGD